jgi:GT2 family glycosyltransferase
VITLCIPVLSKYDLLYKCIASAEAGIVKPDRYLIQDNGTFIEKEKLGVSSNRIEVMTNYKNIGVAASWNKFIKSTQEIRIISNDDVEFFPDTIKIIVDNYDPETINASYGEHVNAFSLFTFPDSFIKLVGYFDETISPNYAYFEDNDYIYRMKLLGLGFHYSQFKYGHVGSATIKSMTHDQLSLHHEKFRLARKNYIRKWGGEPDNEVFKKPYAII